MLLTVYCVIFYYFATCILLTLISSFFYSSYFVSPILQALLWYLFSTGSNICSAGRFCFLILLTLFYSFDSTKAIFTFIIQHNFVISIVMALCWYFYFHDTISWALFCFLNSRLAPFCFYYFTGTILLQPFYLRILLHGFYWQYFVIYILLALYCCLFILQ